MYIELAPVLSQEASTSLPAGHRRQGVISVAAALRVRLYCESPSRTYRLIAIYQEAYSRTFAPPRHPDASGFST